MNFFPNSIKGNKEHLCGIHGSWRRVGHLLIFPEAKERVGLPRPLGTGLFRAGATICRWFGVCYVNEGLPAPSLQMFTPINKAARKEVLRWNEVRPKDSAIDAVNSN